jgi:hypothetical protein
MEVCSSTENGCPRCLAFGNGRPRTQNRPKQTTISPGRRPWLRPLGRKVANTRFCQWENVRGSRSQSGNVDYHDLPGLHKINCRGDARGDWPWVGLAIRGEHDEGELTVCEVLLIRTLRSQVRSRSNGSLHFMPAQETRGAGVLASKRIFTLLPWSAPGSPSANARTVCTCSRLTDGSHSRNSSTVEPGSRIWHRYEFTWPPRPLARPGKASSELFIFGVTFKSHA